jgi:uncharacterized membrane protein
MPRHLPGRILLALAFAFAAIVAANLTLVALNRAKQSEIAERSQFIQQSVALERLNQEIIRALAELAVRNQDRSVTALLNSNGVTFSAPAAQPSAPAPASSAATQPAPSKVK